MQVIRSIRDAISYCIGKKQQFSLDGLPVEILSSISDLLSREDIYCLSLTNSRLFSTLKCRRERLRTPRGRGKLPLLHRIGRDLPNHLVCYCCLVLHKYDRSEQSSVTLQPPFRWFYYLPCVEDGKQVSSRLALQLLQFEFYGRYRFYFVHLQLAMQRFYHGPRFGITTESLSYTEVKEYDESRTLFSTEAQICPGKGRLPMASTHSEPSAFPKTPIHSGETPYSRRTTELRQPGYPGGPTQFEVHNLCLRMQGIKLVARKQLHLFCSDTLRGSSQIFYVCGHISHSTLLTSIVKSYIAGKEPTDCHIAATCKNCNTDYELQLVECGQGDLAIVITRWINLGPGLSPDDPQWKVHVFRPRERKRLSLDTRISYTSARHSFETTVAKKWSAEALSSYNLSFLRARKYKAVMENTTFPGDPWTLYYPRGPMESLAYPISQTGPLVPPPRHKGKLE